MARPQSAEKEVARRRAAWVAAQKTGWAAVPRYARQALRSAPGVVLSAAACTGLALRLLVRDRWPGLWTVGYYVTPPLILAGLFILAGLAWLAGRRRRVAVGMLTLGLICLLWAGRVSWGHSRGTGTPSESRRLIFWNVAHGEAGWERLAGELRKWDADVIGLVESTRDVPSRGRDRKTVHAERAQAAREMEAFWNQHLPEYRVTVDHNGIALLVRGEVVAVKSGYLAPNDRSADGRYVRGEIVLAGQRLHVFVVDLTLGITDSRVPALYDLCAAVDEIAGTPVVVLGDFNTPAEAAAFSRLRQRLLNAFEMRGCGYGASWPLPLPVLTLDQAWVGGGVQVENCRFRWTRLSDHRPLVLDISLPR